MTNGWRLAAQTFSPCLVSIVHDRSTEVHDWPRAFHAHHTQYTEERVARPWRKRIRGARNRGRKLFFVYSGLYLLTNRCRVTGVAFPRDEVLPKIKINPTVNRVHTAVAGSLPRIVMNAVLRHYAVRAVTFTFVY